MVMIFFRNILFLLFFFASKLLNAQTAYRVDYDLTYQMDSTDVSSIKTERMLLDFSEDISVFKSYTTHMKDSILQSKNPYALFGMPKSDFLYKIYKINTQFISLYDYTAYKYELEEDFPNLVWNLNDETKTILGNECQSATTSFAGRDYTAWYTLEIPISGGPYKFYGLPGLILEIYDSKNQYHFEAVGLIKLPSKITIENQGYRKISIKEYRAFLKNIEEKPSLILHNPGIQIPKESLNKYDRSHRERNKAKNNPIELK